MSIALEILLGMYCASQFLYLIIKGLWLTNDVEYEDKNSYYKWSLIWVLIYKSNKLNKAGKAFLETMYSIFFLPAIIIELIIISIVIVFVFIFKKLFVKEKNNESICD